MAAIYILSDYGKLSKKNETFVFSQPDGSSTILFPFKTEQLIVIGKVSISGDVLRMLAKYKIPVTFLSSNGRFNSRLDYGETKNVFLRQKQYRILDDESQSLELSRSIVTGKIRNQISFMQRIKRKTERDIQKINETICKVKNNLIAAERAETIDVLRGCEGMASRNYFMVFGLNIQPDWAMFRGRSKNPPQSNVNAVLSFLYTLLMYRIESAIESQGLDPMAGTLHAVNYGKMALVFDLMEEFRIPVADTVCCSLFNLGQLKPEDFEEHDFSEQDELFPLDGGDEHENTCEISPAKGILLTKSGIKTVIAAFEAKIDSCVLYQPENISLSYQKIVIEQVKQYKRIISGEEKSYKAYYFK